MCCFSRCRLKITARQLLIRIFCAFSFALLVISLMHSIPWHQEAKITIANARADAAGVADCYSFGGRNFDCLARASAAAASGCLHDALCFIWVLGCMRQTNVRLWANRARMQKKLSSVWPQFRRAHRNCCVPVGLCQQQNRPRRSLPGRARQN